MEDNKNIIDVILNVIPCFKFMVCFVLYTATYLAILSKPFHNEEFCMNYKINMVSQFESLVIM